MILQSYHASARIQDETPRRDPQGGARQRIHRDPHRGRLRRSGADQGSFFHHFSRLIAYIEFRKAILTGDLPDPRRDGRDGVRGPWTPESLALHIQAVIQGKLYSGQSERQRALAGESLEHLRRYVELLFQVPGKSRAFSAEQLIRKQTA
jgi:hypothetical protein